MGTGLKIGYKNMGLTFKNLYCEDIAMKIIRSVWDKIIEQCRLQYCGKLTIIELCEETNRLNPLLSSAKIMQVACYMAMAKDVSQRRIRNLIDCGNNQAWYKFVKMIKTVEMPTDESYRFINKVAIELLSYHPIHSQDYTI